MNSKRSNRKPLAYQLQTIRLAMKTYATIIFVILVSGALSLTPTLSFPVSNVIIRNSGSIGTISPLHVEGKYIKDSFGNTVYLRGVNKAEFADAPGGIWMGKKVTDFSQWNVADVKAELDAMKSWGCNVVRCHQAVSCWKFNEGNHRQIMKDFLSLTAERGMYVIYDMFCLKTYPESYIHSLPYPPYQNPEHPQIDVIASEDEFVDYWRSVATELKDYPNVIFELWNEPHYHPDYTDEIVFASWTSVAQRCIDAIRAAGVNQLIIFQWGYGVYANLDFGGGAGLEWILEANLTDSTGNLVYSTHIYRIYSGCGVYSIQESKDHWNSSYAWDYNEIKRAFQIERIDWVGDTLNVPLIIGETGCDLAWTDTELEHELVAWNNTLTIFNEWELHYTAFWWRNSGIFRLLKYGDPWIPPPSTGGEILINALKSQE